ncbi:hypothetical protein CcCBS67573_g00203 [Chytriomyces confervae]|uniref:Cation-transporting ATPase n=1 Tax=Chytriomyces confervae TaxID=246404 RepID=A0A507FSC9_9FUNG|nr:hypothetical protein CcCBS67573_g00203 [Chytriomyces confervae]
MPLPPPPHSSRPSSRTTSVKNSTENLRAPPISIAHGTDDFGSGEGQLLTGSNSNTDHTYNGSTAAHLNSNLGYTDSTNAAALKEDGEHASNCNNLQQAHLPIEYTAITAHRFSFMALSRYIFVSILTLGLVPFICLYLPWLRTYLIRVRCSYFRDAEYVLVEASDGTYYEIKVSVVEPTGASMLSNPTSSPLFNPFPAEPVVDPHIDSHHHHHHRHRSQHHQITMDSEVKAGYAELNENEALHPHLPSSTVPSGQKGESEAESLLQQNGENIIDVETVPILKMLLDKVVHPFYLFQAASVLIWTCEEYYMYSYVIALTSIASIIWEIYSAKKNESSLRDLLKEDADVTVLRNNGFGTQSVPTVIRAQHLVVGDAVLIQTNAPAVADMVLVQGEAVVDESSLTGESVPVVKSAMGYFDKKGELFAEEKCKGNMVFCGSRVTELKPSLYCFPDQTEKITASGEAVVAIVVATGFNSSKGELFRGILYPNKIDFKFHRDSLVFIGVLGVIAIVAFFNRLIRSLQQGYGAAWAVLTSLDIVTIAVPPALPLVLTVGVSHAVSRLKHKQIFCIAPIRVNYAGRIDTFCWDKTGTLTTSKVTFAGVDRCRDAIFAGLKKGLRRDGDGDIERAIAVCHSLNDVNGRLVGSSVDLELFESTRFRLVQNEPTLTWNGHLLPVLARVDRPSTMQVTPTPQSTPVNPNAPDSADASSAKPAPSVTALSINIPKPHLLQEIVSSPTGLAPPSFSISASPESLLILKRFDFDAKLQRMSVLYKPALSHRTPTSAASPASPGSKPILPWEAMTVVTKGSPEAVRNICKKSSIPHDYHSVYTHYATAGWYVLAVAMKVLDGKPDENSSQQPPKANNATFGKGLKKSSSMRGFLMAKAEVKAGIHPSASMMMGSPLSGKYQAKEPRSGAVLINTAEDLAALTRDRVERDMKFLGFILLQNPLKSESAATVSMLTEANIKSVIITGDNVMTGINIARQLKLCNQALLIDVFDGVLGFRRLKESILNPASIPGQDIHAASSIDSLNIEAPNSPQLARIPQKSHTANTEKSEAANELLLRTARISVSGDMGAAPKIRIRSATFDKNDTHESCTKESFRVYPLEEIGRMQNQMPKGTEISVTGHALEMLIATKDGWMTKENLLGERFLDWLVLKGCVFGRMKPDQKTWIIERMMKLGRFVGMCGDGTNDAGALKAAHVGLALSDAEASIVAPFTSAKKRVADVLHLIKEGRCALDISFMAFKYMFMYPLIQLSMTATLNQVGSGLSNNQFLFDDLFVVLLLAFFMLRSGPSRVLSAHRPTDDLLSAQIIYSVMGQFGICTVMFALNYYTLTSEQSWFCSVETASSGVDSNWLPLNSSAPYKISYPCYYIDPTNDALGDMLIKSQENTVVWLFAHFQYAILSLAFIFRSPHRRPLYTNALYIIQLLIVIGTMILMQLSSEGWAGFEFMQTVFSIREGVKWEQRTESLYIAAMNMVLSLIWETIFIEWLLRRRVESREVADRIKMENKIAKQAGILVLSENEGMKAKRSALQQFGMLTGIIASNKDATQPGGVGGGGGGGGTQNGATTNLAWEGYVQSVVAAGAPKHTETRLDMASELRNAQSWCNMDRLDETHSVQPNSARESEAIGDRFELEDGKDDTFEMGFDAWREGRRQTMK